MHKPSNASKDRWNATHYSQVKVSVKPEIAATFKEACSSAGVSLASVLSKFMIDYSQNSNISGLEHLMKKLPFCEHCHKAKQPEAPYETRRLRRAAVKAIISQMEQIALVEECYRDRIPENLQGSKVYDVADESVALMQEVIELLEEIY